MNAMQAWRRYSMVLGQLLASLLLCLSPGRALAQEMQSSRHTTPLSQDCLIASNLAEFARRLVEAQQIEAALAKAQEALTLAEQGCGRDHEYVGYIANDLATIYYNQGRLENAEQLFLRAYKLIFARAGLQHGLTARTASNLGNLYREMARLAEAKRFFERAMAAYQALYGEYSVDVARALMDMARISLREESVTEAQKAVTQARRIFDMPNQPNLTDADRVDIEVIQAHIDIDRSQLQEATERLEAERKRLQAAGPQARPAMARVLHFLGFLETLKGRGVEAKVVYEEELAIYRQLVGDTHPAVARTLHSLAIAYQHLGQGDEAEKHYQRAIAIFTTSHGASDVAVAETRHEYALLLRERGRAEEAIAQARTALDIYEQRTGPRDIRRAYAMSALGLAFHQARQLETAAQWLEDAVAHMAAVRGEMSLDLPPGLMALGEIYLQQGYFAAAEDRLQRAMAIQEQHQATTPRHLAKSLDLWAQLRRAQGRLDEALTANRRATDVLSQRAALTASSLSISSLQEQQHARYVYTNHIDLLYELYSQGGDVALLQESLALAQRAQESLLSQAVAHMAARFATAENALSRMVHERQKLGERWRYLDERLTKTLTIPSDTDPAIRKQETIWQDERRQIERRIHDLDATLKRLFPRYTQLTTPAPLTVGAVRQLLRAHEAVLVQTTTRTATFLWLVRAHMPVAFVRVELGQQSLDSLVRSLRHSVSTAKHGFDVESAHTLYQLLLAPLQPQLKGVQHLMVVPDGALQSLPLAVLLRAPAPAPADLGVYPSFAWLGRDLATSTLPSVSTLQSLRTFAKPSTARQPFLGLGDPELPRPTAEAGGVVSAASDGPPGHAVGQAPLPETLYALRDMARALNGDSRHLFFRERATESAVKNHAELTSFRVVAFGTPCLMADALPGRSESALMLTPPALPGAMDDGLLTASEIAQLELNAEWVILSACNTLGASSTPGAAGLSGLITAFFYAGTRALLVSHWPSASKAAGAMATRTLERFAAEPSLGRAAALHQAIRFLMDGKAAPELAHPHFWGPFVMVGEGGSAGMQAAWQHP